MSGERWQKEWGPVPIVLQVENQVSCAVDAFHRGEAKRMLRHATEARRLAEKEPDNERVSRAIQRLRSFEAQEIKNPTD